VMALYVMGYTAGRAWIEALRTDHANHFLGLRLNDWTALIVFLGGLAWFVTHGGFRAQREASPYYGRDDPDGEEPGSGDRQAQGPTEPAPHTTQLTSDE
jgi:phosphatidylglycerol---prolipoprotein diacylglyceryl transferase